MVALQVSEDSLPIVRVGHFFFATVAQLPVALDNGSRMAFEFARDRNYFGTIPPVPAYLF